MKRRAHDQENDKQLNSAVWDKGSNMATGGRVTIFGFFEIGVLCTTPPFLHSSSRRMLRQCKEQ